MTPEERDKFLARRKVGIGGSDVAAILGTSGTYANRGPYAVWLDKTGRLPPREDGTVHLLELGNLLEGAILLWGAQDLGAELRPGGFVRHPEHPWRLGNTDGAYVINGKRYGAEAKLLVHKGETSVTHEAQCRWYMHITGASVWHLVHLDLPASLPSETVAALAMAQTDADRLAVIKGIRYARFRRLEIKRDLEIEAAMVARVSEWWERHIVQGEPPDPDGSDEAGRYLTRVHSPSGSEWIEDASAAELAAEYAEAAAIEKEAAKRKRLADQRLKALIGDAEGVRGAWGSVKWSRFTRSTLDTKAIEEDHPGLLDKYRSQAETGRLYVKIGGKK